MLAATLALAGATRAQDSGLMSGYTLGYVFDARTSALRPLLGIPGAAVLGKPLDAGIAITRAIISPQQSYALATTASGTKIVRLSPDPPTVSALGADIEAADVIALSPNGSKVAIYSAQENSIRIATGLPDAPVWSRARSTSGIPGQLRLLAISNDGAALVAAFTSDGADSLLRMDADGAAPVIMTSSHISGLRFAGDSRDLLVTDDVDDTVYLARDVSGSPSPVLLAGASEGIAGPIAAEFSADKRLVIVLNGRAGNIVLLDPAGGDRSVFACACVGTGLSRLNGNAVFRLNDPSAGPLWVFDGDAPRPRIVFIPPDRTDDGGQ
jgi:hypothetical protein